MQLYETDLKYWILFMNEGLLHTLQIKHTKYVILNVHITGHRVFSFSVCIIERGSLFADGYC
jgi:hypothetical protein